jgi:hypothetical protein
VPWEGTSASMNTLMLADVEKCILTRKTARWRQRY